MEKHDIDFTIEERRRMSTMSLMKVVVGMVESIRNRELESIDLTSRQFDVILFLMFREHISISQVDIERHFHMTNPTVTGILNRLEAKGFIERIPSDTDKRVKYIKATDRAWEVREIAEQHRNRTDQVLFDDISEEEIEEMLSIIQKMIHNIGDTVGCETCDILSHIHGEKDIKKVERSINYGYGENTCEKYS